MRYLGCSFHCVLAPFLWSSTSCACSISDTLPMFPCMLAPFSWSSTSCACSILLGFPSHVLFVHLRLLSWLSTSCACPHLLLPLSHSFSFASLGAHRSLPSPLLSPLSLLFPLVSLRALLFYYSLPLFVFDTSLSFAILLSLALCVPCAHSCHCRLPSPLQGLRLVHWILQNSIVLALFCLLINRGSSFRAFLVNS